MNHKAIAKRLKKKVKRPFGDREKARQDILRILRNTPDKNQAANVLADWLSQRFDEYLAQVRSAVRQEFLSLLQSVSTQKVKEAKAEMDRHAEAIDGEGWKRGRDQQPQETE